MHESSKGVLLVVDDEPLKRITLQIELSQAGYTVYEAADANAALRILESIPVDVAITDLRMPRTDGLQLLEQIKPRWPETHILLMTAYGSVDTAVSAIKRGACDYLTKPFKTEALLNRLDDLRAARPWASDRKRPEGGARRVGMLLGRSYAAQRLFEQVQALADRPDPVLIQGETGTGKSRVAQTIHQLSERANGPWVCFSCTSCPASSVGTELFVAFERANGGTLYVSEIETLPREVQTRLLHALEQKAFDRPGQAESVPVDVRFLCSASRDLKTLLGAGHFREDLYYRLSAASVAIPPLRMRREDIPDLADHFLNASAGAGGSRRRLSPGAIEVLLGYPWPGNVRELEHVVKRAAVMSASEEIEFQHIQLPQAAPAVPAGVKSDQQPGLTETIAGIERSMIDAALQRAAGNQARAAEFLGIPRTTLRDKMAKYGMNRSASPDQASA